MAQFTMVIMEKCDCWMLLLIEQIKMEIYRNRVCLTRLWPLQSANRFIRFVRINLLVEVLKANPI